jgi:hypothetical protein
VGRAWSLSCWPHRHRPGVSIQLVSPTSGEKYVSSLVLTIERCYVSIQLVSPTSGECTYTRSTPNSHCFHSISFPNEWGGPLAVTVRELYRVSIQLVSPTSGECVGEPGFAPSVSVSIQLVSPTSGESNQGREAGDHGYVSIQLVSPTSGEV